MEIPQNINDERQPYISIIIVAYNAELTIEKALTSILDKRVNPYDYEIIVINDGSTDNTRYVIDTYINRHQNIPIYCEHNTNSGVCIARNRGLELSKGHYVTFMDSDDYYGDGVLFTLIGEVKQYPYIDLWKYGNVEHYYNHENPVLRKVNSVKGFESNDISQMIHYALELEMIPLFGYVWNGVYRMDIIKQNNIQFSDQYIMEDFMFTFEYFSHCTNMKTIVDIYYHYMIILDRLTLSKKKESNYYDMYSLKVKTILDYMKHYEIQDILSYRILSNLYIRYMVSSLIRMDKNLDWEYKIHWLHSLWQDSIYKDLVPYMGNIWSVIGIFSYAFKYRLSRFILVCSGIVQFVKVYGKGLFAFIKSK